MGESPKEAYPRILQVLIDAKLGQVLEYESIGVCLECLRRRGISLADLESEPNLATAIQVTRTRIEEANKAATSGQIDERTKLAAIKLLGHAFTKEAESIATLIMFLVPQENPKIQNAAAESLSQLNGFEELLRAMDQVGPATQKKIQSILISRTESAAALLNAVENGKVITNQLMPSTVQTLVNHRDDKIRSKAKQLFDSSHDFNKNKLVEKYKSTLAVTGDATKGKLIFEKQCATCHKIGGVGQDVGPALDALESKDRAYVLKSILDPNAAVEWKYKSYNVLLVDGRMLSGLVTEESASSLTLALSDGKKETVLHANVDEMRGSSKSFMPEGFERTISPAEMADLLRFIKPK